MSKRFFLVFLITLFLLAGIISPLARQAFGAPAAAPPQPDRVDSPDLAPPGVPAGFYLANSQWSMLDPNAYSAAGAFQFWSWESLNPAPDLYRFDKIDGYIQAALDAGYQGVGVSITTYNGRTAQYYDCTGEFNQGYAQTPYFVRWGPDGVEGTDDDPVVIADEPDTRDCDGDGVRDPWLLPKYTDPYYLQQYQTFVEAMAQHMLNSPYRDRIAWVGMGTGKDGENIPVNNSDDDSLLREISVDDWVGFVEDVIDIYHDAFAAGASKPQLPVLTHNAPFYRYTWERRDIASYANSKDVGISVNGITSDFDNTEGSGNDTGIFDQIRLYDDNIPVALESYGYMMATENEFYWSMARAVDLKPDFIRLSSFWNDHDTANNRTIAQWAARYLGKGFTGGRSRPPSVWSRMREHRDPFYLPYVGEPQFTYSYPTVGNYEFFLKQDHEAPGGVTIPVTDDTRYQASDHRFGTDGQYSTPDLRNQPWHYNEDAYDSVLNSAGLYHVEPAQPGRVPVQTNVDPGWTARRSDQATGNFGFFFDVDDRYLSPPADPSQPHEVRITVTYLDHGNDRWRLMYDSVDGEKAATLYAVRDWDVRSGLAVDDGLPSMGVLPDPKPTYVQKSNTNRWKVATFYITDGYFGNRLPGGNDFYIDSRSDAGVMDGDEYIHHVDVQSLSDIPQVTPTPTPPGATPTPTPTATPGAGDGGSITGYVFENRNGDLTKDPDEPGLPGALLSLYYANQYDDPIAQAVSDNNGFYRFDGVPAGTYNLYVTPPAGWETMLGSRYLIVNENQEVDHQDFPAYRVSDPTATPTPTPTATPTGGRIYGVVFEDANGNGERDGGEPGVLDVTIRLETTTGQLVAETLTNPLGEYFFNDLTPQTYRLLIILPEGWTPTTSTEYYLNPGNDAVERNFGLQPPLPTPTPQPTGRLNAYVWNDLDRDGRQDHGEPPLAGATIIIYDGAGQIELERKLTGGDGYARFDLPAPTDYVVIMTPPWGMAPSTPTEYSVVIGVDVVIEVPFGGYDASQKTYLPHIILSGP